MNISSKSTFILTNYTAKLIKSSLIKEEMWRNINFVAYEQQIAQLLNVFSS